ncbi:two-component sensor histidine kinase [Bacillus sp. BRMEA1]|uniref:sensor histidine kinase n=1 Tax=Neobacillus endophyticus TaxID=2738405 RepID=UPI001564F7FC|nr:HAMP domain-containing sensor histidine kinase [Neobacillus endophyticus]NRD77114.1 two-component sensor histidine kinase [Neobacillus endophyticus]
MKRSDRMKRLLWITEVIFALLICWSLVYVLAAWFYNRIGYSPSAYYQQVINSLAGFFLFGLVMYIVSKLGIIEERQNKFLLPIIDAMKMMAEGNFNIDLSFYNKQMDSPNHPYYQIVQSIKHAAEQLGETEQMRQEFISNVSHEIQSPLTSISGFAHALKNAELRPEERNHYLHIIETECMRLSKLSENLLKLTTLESDQLPFERKSYRLDHQIRRIILACEVKWVEKDIEMNVDLPRLMVSADEELMEQVWTNLIYNSIKFTPEKGSISVALFELDQEHISIIITDTGIGMDKETQMHAFERFYKGDKSRNRTFGGNGLGLSIVKKIIELHQGEIHIHSELGEGTEVTVTIPKSDGGQGREGFDTSL